MSPELATLLATAEARIDGLDFNAESFARRAAAEAAHGHAVVYEVVLEADATLPGLAQDLLPKLQDHLRSKGLSPAGAPGLLVWLWWQDRAHLFSGPVLLERLAAATRPALPG
jgi:hypothetical protein